MIGKVRMVKLLKKCGYYIGNENGKINWKSNILDCVLFTVYFVISLVNSLSLNPSNSIFVLNTISISRLILKNYIEQCKIVTKFPQKEGYVPTNITMVHFLKIVSETSSLILLLMFVVWNKFSSSMSNGVVLMVIIVLVETWIENVLCMFERLYDAQPIPLVMNQIN